MGGSREKFDICVYPRLGKAVMADEGFPGGGGDGKGEGQEGQEQEGFAMAQVPLFPHLYGTDREWEQAKAEAEGKEEVRKE